MDGVRIVRIAKIPSHGSRQVIQLTALAHSMAKRVQYENGQVYHRQDGEDPKAPL